MPNPRAAIFAGRRMLRAAKEMRLAAKEFHSLPSITEDEIEFFASLRPLVVQLLATIDKFLEKRTH